MLDSKHKFTHDVGSIRPDEEGARPTSTTSILQMQVHEAGGAVDV